MASTTPEPERAALLEERQQRRLRRRVRDRREVPEDLVHVDHRPQARRARLAAHPRDDLVEQQRHEEHPLGVAEVRDREDRDPRLPLRRVEQAGGVERLAFEPLGEARGGQQPVEPHGQVEALLRREERLEVDDADLGERRRLDLLNQRRQIEVPPLRPGGPEEAGHERVLAAPGRRVDAGEREHARRRAAGALGHRLAVGAGRGWRRMRRS